MQEKETTKTPEFLELADLPVQGRLLALDPGTLRIGVALSDESRLIASPLPRIERRSWKKLLNDIRKLIEEYDAIGLVIGLPLETDGSESPMSAEARNMAHKFRLSLQIPVFLQDERVTSYEAKGRLWEKGVDLIKSRDLVDSEAAAIILTDFLSILKSASK
ncbi:MAG: Holliday junction resolvase RuvX [Acidobacteria bacterium]|nr:Holliday junction resolvase RuvX [Acidobacteriota bacterium]